MEYLTSVMRGESKSTVCVTVGTGDGKSEAQLVEKPPEEKERLKAAELLGRRYGLYTDKVDVNSAASVIISGENDLEE
jgi:phage terminase small subunit